jgi:hypothetical protein
MAGASGCPPSSSASAPARTCAASKTEIAQTRRKREAAVGEQDFEAASLLRDKEGQLILEKDSRRREWAAADPDPSSLAEKVGQLSDEIEQLRGQLRQHGT